ncbi:hypothetical protein XU18_2482 [Perkinsela sp. CCAP 1560/4]|nr:hypothetical protein XU18_2623 [Perkinsela sp. CCAP 1560/4]KNH06722.1 hypothetical protein XU18_2482 [Perkinsela sp. CCAP 1560/4]|eukprot:KNH06524.1 hypothetical protein XU18_2623 [Perkinsela sp. CCAP 1560/4]
MSSVLTLRPLRRCAFATVGAYSMFTLYFDTLDSGNRPAQWSSPRRAGDHTNDIRSALRQCIREHPTLSAVALTSVVASRGACAILGSTLAILIYRWPEIIEMRKNYHNMKGQMSFLNELNSP